MAAHREFFAVRTVGDVIAGFRPARRTAPERVPLEAAHGRVPAEPVVAPAPLPGFARATVDGYAVRAADTYGASEGLPSYLEVRGAVRMGHAPEVEVDAGGAVQIATGGALPAGANAVVMVEHTNEAMAGTIEVVRPVAPGEGVVGADEDVVAGAPLVRPGRPLRAADLGLLAAAGITDLRCVARPRVAILSTGDEVVDPATTTVEPGQVRDAIAVALAALVREAGGEPELRGIVPDDRDPLAQALEAALAAADAVVVSGGSSVGMRDETAAVLPRPGGNFFPAPAGPPR